MLTPEQFSFIKTEAYRAGTPRGFERAILREYLQCEFLTTLSQTRLAASLALIGGAGLPLLYELDRFSEDLDFDNCGLSPAAPTALFQRVAETLSRRGYAVTFRGKRSSEEHGGALVFRELLFSLGLSAHRSETLVIKTEYTTPSVPPAHETRLLSRFGFVAMVLTEPLPVLCARKAVALLLRKRTQPRDLYDLSWFLARRITPDLQTLQSYGFASQETLTKNLLDRLDDLKPKLAAMVQDMLPLLLLPERAKQLEFLPQLIRSAWEV